jgi:hypothetical protein
LVLRTALTTRDFALARAFEADAFTARAAAVTTRDMPAPLAFRVVVSAFEAGLFTCAVARFLPRFTLLFTCAFSSPDPSSVAPCILLGGDERLATMTTEGDDGRAGRGLCNDPSSRFDGRVEIVACAPASTQLKT